MFTKYASCARLLAVTYDYAWVWCEILKRLKRLKGVDLKIVFLDSTVVLNDGEPEVNPEWLWQTDDLEQLMFRTYRLTSALRQVHERMHDESAQLETFVKDLGRHLLDPNRKSH